MTETSKFYVANSALCLPRRLFPLMDDGNDQNEITFRFQELNVVKLKSRDQNGIWVKMQETKKYFCLKKKNASSQLLQIPGHGSSHWFTLASTLTKTQLNMKYGV